MIIRLISTLLLTLFIYTPVSEAFDAHHAEEVSSIVEYTPVDCGDCDDEGCDNSEGHCTSRCICIPKILRGNSYSSLDNVHYQISDIDRYLFIFYQSPHINPALKPPLFS